METRKRSVTDLGLEAPAADQGGKRPSLAEGSDLGLEASRAGKSSSSEEEKKKLFVLAAHTRGLPYTYSLYALDIPSPDTVVKVSSSTSTTFTTTTTTMVNGVPETQTTNTTTSYSVPERFPLKPFLQFTESQLPHEMACFRLGSKLYFLGGEKGRRSGGGKVSFPRKVLSLDLSSPSPSLKPAPPMHSGKGSPLVGFVADGKLYVISGTKYGSHYKRGVTFDRKFGWKMEKHHDSLNLVQFEIFDPSAGPVGEWKKAENPPPFEDADSLTHVIVGGKAIINGCSDDGERFTLVYDIEAGTWRSWRPVMPLRHVVGGKETTLWYISPRGKEEGKEADVPLLIRTNVRMSEEEEEEEKFKDVIKYYFKHPRSRYLTSIAGCLCFVETELGSTLANRESRMNVTLIHVSGGENNGVESAEYLTSAHYVVQEELALGLHYIRAVYDI